MAFSAENRLPTTTPDALPAAQPGVERTTSCSWRTIFQTAGGIAFLGVLGWEVCRISGLMLQLATDMAVTSVGRLF
jgi:hypothetical protein